MITLYIRMYLLILLFLIVLQLLLYLQRAYSAYENTVWIK